MRAADWIAKRILAESDTIFGVTGGCIINCVDGFYKQGLNIISMHHEQSAAMAADGFARIKGSAGFCYATSGPGGQNLLTGIASAYYDSVPVVSIIGQVPSKQVAKTDIHCGLRQFGFQETHNYKMAKTITKSSEIISCQEYLRATVDAAIRTSLTHRMGPTVVEICDDMQRAEVDGPIEKYVAVSPSTTATDFWNAINEVLKSARRPVLILGAGIIQARCGGDVSSLVDFLRMPVLLSWGGKELLDESNPFYIGGFGISAERAGNYVLKHSDVIISIGCRLDTHSFGFNYNWLDGKKIIMADVDLMELAKIEDIIHGFHVDIRSIMRSFVASGNSFNDWVKHVRQIRKTYPQVTCIEPYENGWNPHSFIRLFSSNTDNAAIVVGDAGQTLSWLFRAWQTKIGQKLFSDFNNSCMGYSLPAAIGAAFAAPSRIVYCVIGDGSFMMNIQELQTIAHFNLNVRVIVIDNAGYGMIRQTQTDWPHLGQGVACGTSSGLTFPNYAKIADAFGIRYLCCENEGCIKVMTSDFSGPMIIRVPIKEGSKIEPKLLFGDDLWNQKPYLSQEEKIHIDKALSGE